MTGTTTPRLGLYKPDGDDNVNVDTDLNDNADLLDVVVGTTVCTSSTRPATPYEGQGIYETDTGKFLLSNGTPPLSGSWIDPVANGLASTNVTVGGSGGAATFPGRLLSSRATAASTAVDAQQVGDSVSRFNLRNDGQMEWGAGSGARDTNLYRSGANTLKTDDSLIVGGTVTATGNIETSANLDVAGDTNVDGNLTVSGVGRVQLVRKTADESVTSSTVLQNDNHLVLPVVANASYSLFLLCIFSGDTAGDIKFDWAVPAGTVLRWADQTGTSGLASDTDFYSAPGGSTQVAFQIWATVVTSSTAGSIQFRWAQNASSATATIVRTNSTLRLDRVA
ncbi:hypothetical protein [Streptomyces sp. MMBL 11-1]|uniref:hypothetical protein n=1 Tax=Streptomyces sp. MMBL 11-1 TaxID=3026420 RepID=UPI00235E0A5C|nr:hypothetical protein [Streptomyces sp. MMBL 11-1]